MKERKDKVMFSISISKELNALLDKITKSSMLSKNQVVNMLISYGLTACGMEYKAKEQLKEQPKEN